MEKEIGEKIGKKVPNKIGKKNRENINILARKFKIADEFLLHKVSNQN